MATEMDIRLMPGFYMKRSGLVYLTIYTDGEKFTYATGNRPNEATKTWFEKFKKDKIAESTKEEKVEKGVRVQTLFDDYVAYLRAKEKEKGDYATAETTTSYRNESFFKCHLSPFFGKMKPADVAERLTAYREQREHEKASPSTLNSELRVLRAAMNRGWKNNKVRQVELPKEYPFNYAGEKAAERTGTITDDQIKLIVKNMAPHLVPVFLTAVYTGARPKELRALPASDVVLTGDAPHIKIMKHKNSWRSTKAGKPKVLAIVDELLPVLKAWAADSKKKFPSCQFFFHLNGERLGNWKTAWNNALRRADIPAGTLMFYDARRTARTLLGDYGVSVDDAKEQLGHATEAMSTRYNQSTAHVTRIIEAHRGKGKEKTAETAPASSNGVLDGLKELAGMLKDGLIDRAEFDVLKSNLIAPK
jgi:integrase